MIGVSRSAAARSIFVAAVLAAGAAALAQAQQMYRWTDENGRVHITDTPPPPSAKGIQKQRGTSTTAPAAPQEPFELTRAMRDFPVVLYTSPPCKQPCDEARAALNQRGVPFREVQVWDEETQAQ